MSITSSLVDISRLISKSSRNSAEAPSSSARCIISTTAKRIAMARQVSFASLKKERGCNMSLCPTIWLWLNSALTFIWGGNIFLLYNTPGPIWTSVILAFS